VRTRKSSASPFWMKEGRWIFKLPHDRQTIRFDVRPETFAPMRSGRMIWSYVRIADLDAGELKGLLAQAWREVAPKTLARSVPEKPRESHAEMPASQSMGLGIFRIALPLSSDTGTPRFPAVARRPCPTRGTPAGDRP
jgi:hypothetical protein